MRVKGGGDPKKSKTTPEQQTRIDKVETFIRRPDGVTRYRPWMRSLLEDLFVIDAPALYCQRSRGGQLIALKQVDGATIKVLLDDWGRTPMPYSLNGARVIPPAYQQALKGFPAVNYSVEDLIYRPYNRRVHKAYGFSPVEQCITTVNIALRRQMFTLAYYTEGNVPEALIGTPEQWNPEQISAFQNYWDMMLTGNLATRRRAKFVPGGVAKTFIPTKEPDLKNPMDEWLARVVCFAFSISPQPFVQQMNRATAGTAQEVAKEEGIEPLKEYVAELWDDIITDEFGYDDLEFAFDEEVEVDQLQQTTILSKQVEDGAITLNQYREALGMEPDPNPAADMLMVKTATGWVPIEANTMEAKQAEIDAGLRPDPTAPPPALAPPGGAPVKPGATKPAKPKAGAKPAQAAPKAGKLAHEPHALTTPAFDKAARRSRRIAPVPFDRPKSARAERRIAKLLKAAFAKAGKKAAAAVRRDLGKVEKAKTPKEIADDIDLSAIEDVVADLADELADAAEDYALQALASIGVADEADLVDQVNERAVQIARDTAGELIGKSYVDGEYVDNPNAEYRIDESTRDMIREAIADGLEENIGNEAIADAIGEIGAFSDERAQLIAFTEIRNSNSRAAVEGYKIARDEAGVNVKKEWILGPNPCPICEDNADDGPIELEDEFSSGDTEPVAHPRCECAISPVVDDESSADAEAEE